MVAASPYSNVPERGHAEAENLKTEVAPVLGEEMQKIVEKVLSTPKPIAVRSKQFLE